MSDPLAEVCEYCGSPDVMDDAWWCASSSCYAAYMAGGEATMIVHERLKLDKVYAWDDMDAVGGCNLFWNQGMQRLHEATIAFEGVMNG